jgi:hypothetical protein
LGERDSEVTAIYVDFGLKPGNPFQTELGEFNR